MSKDFFDSFCRAVCTNDKNILDFWDPTTRDVFITNLASFLEHRQIFCDTKSWSFQRIGHSYVAFWGHSLTNAFAVITSSGRHYVAFVSSCLHLFLNNDELTLVSEESITLYIDPTLTMEHGELNLLLNSLWARIKNVAHTTKLSIPAITIYWLSPSHPIRAFVSRRMFVEPGQGHIFCFTDELATEPLLHELIHALYYRNLKGWPSLVLREGIAEAFFDDSYYQKALSHQKGIDYSVLLSSKLERASDEFDAILLGLFCRFLIRTYGPDKFNLAYQMDNGHIDITMARVYGQSYSDIRAKFLAWLNRTFQIERLD